MKIINPGMTLASGRVSLIPLRAHQYSQLKEIANNPKIWEHYLFDGTHSQQFDRYYETMIAASQSGTIFPFVIYSHAHKSLVGSTQFREINYKDKKLEIGATWLIPECWRTGLNTEIKLLMLRYAFEEAGACKVWLKTDENNTRSRNAILGIGATEEGLLKWDMIKPDGSPRNSAYYGLYAENWSEIKTKLKTTIKAHHQKKQPDLIYRTAEEKDAKWLTQLGYASYYQYRYNMNEADWAQFSNKLKSIDYLKLIQTGKGFICESEGKPVGMAFIIPSGNPDELFRAEWSHIRMVGILPEYRGYGIVGELIGQCIQSARQTGEKHLALHTNEAMSAARNVYTHAGFKQYCELPDKFGLKYWIYMYTF